MKYSSSSMIIFFLIKSSLNPLLTNPFIVKGMTDSTFREFSKMLLMESRNFEEVQLHKGITDDDLGKIKLKISKWEGNNIPK